MVASEARIKGGCQQGEGLGPRIWVFFVALGSNSEWPVILHEYPSPPLSFPTPCPSPGGVGDRHLLNPKIFIAAHCGVVAKSAAQSIPVESGEHVQEFKVKWSRTKKIYTGLVKE